MSYKIVGFFENFNRNLLNYFYKSPVYKYFIKSNTFFKDVFLKNMDKSLVVTSIKKVTKNIEPKDIGFFILLVVILNTLAMVLIGNEIDIFSRSARVLFFCLGIFLLARKT